MDDWSQRIRSYRQRSGLSQEALAELFQVSDRTVRRWEAGLTQPPLDVRQRLQRTTAPVISRPEVAALAEVVRSSPLGIMLLDNNLHVIAMSVHEHAFWQRQFNIDLRGQSWEPYIPPFFRQIVDAQGGWRAAIKAGASSITGDSIIPMPGNETENYSVRVQYTVLRMADGTQVHTCISGSIPKTSILHPARLTFIDEIEQEG